MDHKMAEPIATVYLFMSHIDSQWLENKKDKAQLYKTSTYSLFQDFHGIHVVT